MKKKFTAMLASATALALMLAGCAAPGSTSSSGSASSGGASSSVVDQSTPAPPEKAFKTEPIDFTWKPVVYSNYQRQVRSPETEQFYRDFVNAVMKGESVVYCEDEKTAKNMLPILQTIFPVINGIGCDFEYVAGAVHIYYYGSDAERDQTIAEFGRKIEEHIEKAVCKGDTPTMAAIALYHSFVGGLDYDFAALEDKTSTTNVTPYRALMTGEGICQSFGPAYAYLCMQLGINAIEAGGSDFNQENSHVWTMLELNGHHYFADPTFEAGQGGSGLRYFGQNSETRELDNYPLKNVGLGFNLADADEYDLSDDTFAPLWDVQNIYEICRTDSGMEIKCHSPFTAQRSIPIEDGKRILVTPCDDNEVPLENEVPPKNEGNPPLDDRYEPILEDPQGTAWSGADFDLAFVGPNLVWIESPGFTGAAQYWLLDDGRLCVEVHLTEDLEFYKESEDRMILKSENGEYPVTKASAEVYERLSKQSDEFWKN